MRKIAFFLLLLLFLSVAWGGCGETEAADLTSRCTFVFPAGSRGQNDLRDGSYLSVYTGAFLEIITPPDAPCYGLYLCFSGREAPFRVETQTAEGVWSTALEDDRRYANSFVALPGLTHLRIVPVAGDSLCLAEVSVWGQGRLPDWVQDWRPFTGTADLLVLSAHADDEWLFFGGVIPLYAKEQGKHVVVCYLTDQTPCRRNELLDGLWLGGIREYPVMGVFPDIKNNSLADSYDFWGEQTVVDYVAGLFRRYQPQVVVTHDLRGEYGHGAHRVCADAAVRACTLAADETARPDLGSCWQVKKLYLHLYGEETVELDWHEPLDAFGGRTALEVARAAFACHQSQQGNGLVVEDGGDYANHCFGLYFTAVGPDTEKRDLFEHLP